MRTAPGIRWVVALVAAAPLFTADAQGQYADAVGVSQWTSEELENLLAPVALYPDPILAQVLVAASYPDEVELAAQHVRLYGADHIDDQPWDISVKAVAHYTPVLNLLADRPDWTTALGQAYAEQPEDVMAAVQSLRAMARAHGNLVTTREHEVVVEDYHIRILPAHPRVVYVPVYDPLVVYYRPIVHLGVYRSGWSFGIGFPIGVWLTYDFDWRRRHVYYHGWDSYLYRGGWIHRSRPFIVINNIYVRPRPRYVYANRRISDYFVDYDRFDRYNYVHRTVDWDRHRRRDDRRYVSDGPSWDRDRRAVPGNDGNRISSWGRSGSERVDERERRALPRSSTTTAEPRGGGVSTPPDRTRPESAQPPRARPRTSEPRTQPRASEAPRIQPRASVPSRIRPERDQAPRERLRAPEPRAAEPRATSPRDRPQGIQRQRAQPQRVQPPRTQPQQRAQPQRVQPPRTQPQQRAQPQRVQPPRTQPQQRARPQGSSAPRATPAPPRARSGPPSTSPGRSGQARAARPRASERGRGSNEPPA